MYNENKEKFMEKFIDVLQKIFMFDKEPQRIGLTQFKEPIIDKEHSQPSLLKNKDIKLSDLIRGEVIK